MPVHLCDVWVNRILLNVAHDITEWNKTYAAVTVFVGL
jgi:hypothetical protein